MVAVPAETPVTNPVPETVATDVVLLFHAPPNVASLKRDIVPAQKEVVPVIAAGEVLMVIALVTMQLDPNE